MAPDQSTVADIFRRAQAIHRENPEATYKQIKTQLVKEFTGQAFPPLYNLTIPNRTHAPLKKTGLPACRW